MAVYAQCDTRKQRRSRALICSSLKEWCCPVFVTTAFSLFILKANPFTSFLYRSTLTNPTCPFSPESKTAKGWRLLWVLVMFCTSQHTGFITLSRKRTGKKDCQTMDVVLMQYVFWKTACCTDCISCRYMLL